MKKFEGILICTDLDGTLLRNDKSISKENIRAIEYFKSEGGRFTFITGRMPYFVTEMYEAIKPNAPIGCYNGGGVYDFETDTYLWARTVPESTLDLAEYVCDQIEGMSYQVTLFDKIYFRYDNAEMKAFRKRTNVPHFVFEDGMKTGDFPKIVLGHPNPEMATKAIEILKAHPRGDEFDYVCSEPTLAEILPKGVHKGAALPRIAEAIGVDERRVIALGDFDNDVTMIRDAALGVAVGNATPEVKAVADLVTVTNEEHAIARIISMLDSGELVI